VLEPIGRLCSYFPEINNAISKRNKKALDYDSARSKVKKLLDKPSDDITKLPRVKHPTFFFLFFSLIRGSDTVAFFLYQAEKECDDAKEVFEAINTQLVTELPQLLDLRIPYLDPSFEAMVRLQCRFSQEGYEKLSGVQRFVFSSLCSLGFLAD
jgi:hypothetical protein